MDESRGLNNAQLIAGLTLVVLGAAFLVLQGVDAAFIALWWPAFVVVPGLALLIVGLVSGERAAFLAIPGCVITAVGALLAFQNVTGLWKTWAYLWPLAGPAAVGVGLTILGARIGKRQLVDVGWRLALAGAILTVVLGLFFELVVGLSGPIGPIVGRIVWPLALIAFGLWLMLPKRRRSKGVGV